MAIQTARRVGTPEFAQSGRVRPDVGNGHCFEIVFADACLLQDPQDFVIQRNGMQGYIDVGGPVDRQHARAMRC